MSSLIEGAWQDANERFAAVVAGLRAALTLDRPLPEIRLERTRDPAVTARVLKNPWGDVLVEIGDDFLGGLLDAIEQLHEDQLTLLVLPPSGARADALQHNDVRTALFAIAEQFVMHHELFHLLCGHLDQHIASAPGRHIALDETHTALHASVSTPFDGPMTAERELSLFIELEADNSALQWLADRCAIGDFMTVLPSMADGAVPISRAAPADQAVAFRLCFAAVWLVLLLFERSGASEQPSATHPWPSARLLALLMTLMPYYVQGVVISEDEQGQRFTVLNDDTLGPTKAFLLDVVRPAMKFVVAHADGDRIVSRYEKADPKRSDLFADVLRDLKALLLDDEVTTPGGRQVLTMLQKRRHYADLFSSYRYLTASDIGEA